MSSDAREGMALECASARGRSSQLKTAGGNEEKC